MSKNRYYNELCEEISHDVGIQYDNDVVVEEYNNSFEELFV